VPNPPIDLQLSHAASLAIFPLTWLLTGVSQQRLRTEGTGRAGDWVASPMTAKAIAFSFRALGKIRGDITDHLGVNHL